jgi:hypothetical protein
MPAFIQEQLWVTETLQALRATAIASTQKYNNDPTLDARYLRPSDLTGIQGLSLSNISSVGPTGTSSTTNIEDGAYGFSIDPATEGIVSFTVPQGFGMLFAGWYCDGDLGASARLAVKIDTVIRQEVWARAAYDNPYKLFVANDQVAFAKQGAKVQLIIDNASASTVSATIWPIVWVCAPRAQIQMQEA